MTVKALVSFLAGAAAAKKIEETTESQATVAVFGLDISSTESVDKFVELIKEDYDQQLDILVRSPLERKAASLCGRLTMQGSWTIHGRKKPTIGRST